MDGNDPARIIWIKGKQLQFGPARRLLLIQLGDIGDVVLSLPCVRTLREHFPRAQVVVAVRKKAKTLIEDCPWASGVIVVDQHHADLLSNFRYQVRFIRHLRRRPFDAVFDLRTGTRGALLALLSGAPLRIGFDTTKEAFWRNWIFTHLMARSHDPHQHQSRLYLSLLAASGLTASHPLPVLEVSESARIAAIRLLKRHGLAAPQPFMVFQPFSLWRYKEWGIEKSATLIRQLTLRYNLPVVVIGTVAERSRVQQIVDQTGSRTINLAGETSLRTLAAVIHKSRFLLGVDSAGGHIASAVGTPCLVIFGPGEHEVWAPLGDQGRIIYKELPCVPCDRKGCEDSGHSRCLEELTVAEVAAAVDDMLAGAAASPGLPQPAPIRPAAETGW